MVHSTCKTSKIKTKKNIKKVKKNDKNTMRKHRGKHLEQRQLMNYCAVSTDS